MNPTHLQENCVSVEKHVTGGTRRLPRSPHCRHSTQPRHLASRPGSFRLRFWVRFHPNNPLISNYMRIDWVRLVILFSASPSPREPVRFVNIAGAIRLFPAPVRPPPASISWAILTKKCRLDNLVVAQQLRSHR